jgi:hypothetical protein
MNKVLILAGLVAVAISSPVLAKPAHHHAKSVNDPATAQAFAPAGTDITNPRQHIIVNNNDQGTDPDPRVRLMLQIDPPIGGTN